MTNDTAPPADSSCLSINSASEATQTHLQDRCVMGHSTGSDKCALFIKADKKHGSKWKRESSGIAVYSLELCRHNKRRSVSVQYSVHYDTLCATAPFIYRCQRIGRVVPCNLYFFWYGILLMCRCEGVV